MTDIQKQLGQYTGRARFVMGSPEATRHVIDRYAQQAQCRVMRETGRPTLKTSNWTWTPIGNVGHRVVEFDFDYAAHCEGDIHYNLRRFLEVACRRPGTDLEPYRPVDITAVIDGTLEWRAWG